MRSLNVDRVARQAGFTLIEIMAAVAIVAIVAGIVVVGASRVDERKVKQAAHDLGTKIRYLHHRSSLDGLYITLILDLGQPDEEGRAQSFKAESSSDPILISKQESWDVFKGAKGAGIMAKVVEEAERGGGKDKGGEAEGTDGGAPPAAPAREQVQDELFEPGEFKDPVRMKDVWLEGRAGTPITEGEAVIHFFPNGQIERAVINLTDTSGKAAYSVATDPLRGRADVEPAYREIGGRDEEKGGRGEKR